MTVDSDEKEKSFKDLYDKYYEPVYNYVFHQIVNRENAEDVTANAFLNALHFLKRKKPRIDNFHAWIFKIATNEIRKFMKQRGNGTSLAFDDEREQLLEFIDHSPDRIVREYSEFLLLRKEMAKLRPAERSLVTLYFFEAKSYSEISAILKIGENTLRPKMSRILKKLYVKLKDKI